MNQTAALHLQPDLNLVAFFNHLLHNGHLLQDIKQGERLFGGDGNLAAPTV